MLNSYLETRLISFVVKIVFTQKRRRSGPLQVRGGPVDPSLPIFEFVLQLRLRLGSLKGDNLCLELVTELLQCLLLSGDIITVESRLLPIESDWACCFVNCSFMSASIWRIRFSYNSGDQALVVVL